MQELFYRVLAVGPCTPPVSAEEVSTQTTCTSSIDSHAVAGYSICHDADMRQFY